MSPVAILLTVLVFCFSYVSKNFWPWYNHLVIVLELVAFYFLFLAILRSTSWKTIANLALSAFFIVFAIFTKQDGGALGLAICYAILVYNAWLQKAPRNLVIFTVSFVMLLIIAVVPFLQYDFLRAVPA